MNYGGYNHSMRLPALIAGIIAAVLGAWLILIMQHLQTKWLVAFLAGTFVLLAALASGRFERVVQTMLFLIIPINVDFNFDMGVSLYSLRISEGTPLLGISAVDILLCFLYLAWIFRLMQPQKPGHKERVVWPYGSWFIWGFMLWGAFSMFNAENRQLSLFLLFGFLKAFLLFFYIANNIKTRRDLWLVVQCLILGLIAESLLGLAQQAAGRNLGLSALGERTIEKEVSIAGEKIFRIGGTLGHPNYFGGYLTSVLPLIYAFTQIRLPPLARILAMFSLALGTVVLVLTYSRSAWLASFAALGFLFVYQMIKSGKQLPVIPTVIAVLLSMAVLTPLMPQIKARMEEDDRGSTSSRIPQVKMAWSMIKDHPVIGVGLNNNGLVSHLYETYVEEQSGNKRVFEYQAIHNVFLALTAETGIPGILWLISFVVITVRQGRKKITSIQDPVAKTILFGMLVSLIARIPHDAFHTGNLAANTFFWLYAACLVADFEDTRNG